MELEDERKSHREHDKSIWEQQMKIVDLCDIVTSSGFDTKSGQVLLQIMAMILILPNNMQLIFLFIKKKAIICSCFLITFSFHFQVFLNSPSQGSTLLFSTF